MKFVRKISFRWQTDNVGFFGGEIAVQLFFKLFQYAFIDMLPGNKLAVIKPLAVIQKQFYIRRDQLFAMFIHRLTQLIFNLGKTVKDNFALLFSVEIGRESCRERVCKYV